MSDEFSNLSVPEIKALIERAEQEIERRKKAGRESLRLEIEAKLVDAGLDLGDLFPEATKTIRKAGNSKSGESGKVAPSKYKDHVSGDTWSGRGPRPPHWVKSVMSQRGWTLEEFKQSEEFLAQN
jgi:DNA-binding protein H-NS